MRKKLEEDLEADFWSRILIKSDDECWEYQGQIDREGYGFYCTPWKKVVRAHRMAYSLANMTLPGKLCILHSCDNRACCNPKHLFLGTRLDNTKDMVNKNRQFSGPRLKRKESLERAKKIRKLHSTKRYSIRELAERFEVGYGCVRNIVIGKSCK